MRATYHGDSVEVQAVLDDVLERLPNAVGKFAFEFCTFFSVGRGLHGQTLRTHYLRNAGIKPFDELWVIVLHEDDVLGDDAHQLVAHEIAHAWLEWHRDADGSPDFNDEDAVDTLAADWLASAAKSGHAGAD